MSNSPRPEDETDPPDIPGPLPELPSLEPPGVPEDDDPAGRPPITEDMPLIQPGTQ